MSEAIARRDYNRTQGALRLAALYVFVGFLLWLSAPTPRSVYAGLPFLVVGEAIRFWAAGHLRKTVELITSGPYRYTRNPLYLGRLLIFVGLCLICSLPLAANWVVMLAGLAVFFGYYLPRKERVEPARLRQQHGAAYERYAQAVPALLPTLRPYAEGASTGWSSERMLRNREHWMVIGLTLIWLLQLWRASKV
ncbi:MAG TPA: isoprenylcysteine carboxylmethyltransferase family protein [Candidatus Polarisedimenticolaceae bacterium]|nr:isoprenylcysteine carboxylmethyltransferase family protein [Candidatus Polarisedimenticolaceae bacterium]